MSKTKLLGLVSALAFVSACSGANPGAEEVTKAGEPIVVAGSQPVVGAAGASRVVPEGYVPTPNGWFHSSCIASIDENEHIRDDGKIERRLTGEVRDVPVCKYPPLDKNGRPVEPGSNPTIDGWIEAGQEANLGALSNLSATWVVPPAPASTGDGQVIYLFPGITPYPLTSSTNFIMQPVLEWAGGQWTATSWNCCVSGTTFHGPSVNVNAGDTIFGSIAGTGCDTTTGICSTWNILTEDATTGASATLATSAQGNVMGWAYGGALETYYVNTCSDLPNASFVTFSNIVLENTSQQIVNPTWQSALWSATPACGYGEFSASPSALTVETGANGSSRLPASDATGSPGVTNQGTQQTITAAGQSLCWSNVNMTGVTAVAATVGNGNAQQTADTLLVTFNGAQIGDVPAPETDQGWTADTAEWSSASPASGSGTLCLVGAGPAGWIAAVSQLVLVGPVRYEAVNAVASSIEDGSFPAADAIDDNFSTRWSSAISDPQWIYVDLGSTQPIAKVVLAWETAAAKAYMIQTSTDAVHWTTIYGESNGQGGTETLNIMGSGRYVRMYGTQRTTQYGYSLWEAQIFAPPSGQVQETLLASSATGSSGVLNQGNQQILTATGQSLCWSNVGMSGVTSATVTLGNGEPPGDQLLVTFDGTQIGAVTVPHTDDPWWADTPETTPVAPELGSGTLCLVGSGTDWIASVSQIVLVGNP